VTISTAIYAAFTAGGYAHYTCPDGRTRHYLGCTHKTPKALRRHTANLDPFVSPTRASGTDAPADPLASESSPDVGDVASVPEPRSTGLPASRTGRK